MAVDMFGFPIKTEEVTEEVTDTESIINPKEVTPKVTEEVTEEKTQPVDMFGFPIKTPLAQPTETTEAVDMFGFPVKAEEKETDDEIGFWDRWKASLSQGVESFSDIGQGFKLAAQDLTEDEKGAAKTMQAMKAEQAMEALTATPTLTAREIQRTFEESGLIPAGMKVPSFIVEQILKSGPQMIPPIIAGLGATALASPLGPLAPIVGAGAGVLTYGLQQFGNFMNTQGLEMEAPEDLDTASAAKWSAVTAPIGYFADRFTLGLTKIPQKLVSKEIGLELAKRTAAKSAAGAATKGGIKGATIGIIAEAPTEVLETWAEFKQAGIDTDSPEAKEAYFESFWAAAGMGGGLGGVTQAYQGYNKFKKEQLELKQKESKDDQKIDQDDVDNTQKTKSQIINDVLGTLKEDKKKVDAEKVRKAPLETLKFDKPALKELGLKDTSVTGRALAGVDLNTEEGLQMAKDILDPENLQDYKDLNAPAIKTLRNRVNRQLNKLKKEAKDVNTGDAVGGTDQAPTGASPTVPKLQPKAVKPVTKRTKEPVRSPVVDDTGRIDRITGAKELVSSALANSPKNPTVKPPKVGQKIKLGRIRNYKAEVVEGVVEPGADGNLALTYDVPAKDKKSTPTKVSIPLNNEQVVNPSPNDIKSLDSLANRIKAEFPPSKKEELILEKDAEALEEAKLKDKLPSTKAGKFSQRRIIQGLKSAKNLGDVFKRLRTNFKSSMNVGQATLLEKLNTLPNIANTIFQISPKMQNRKDPSRPSGKSDQYGLYTTVMDTVQISDSADVETILHEATHAATANAVRENIQNNTPLGQRIMALFEATKAADINGEFATELASIDEFITEAFNNQNFQKFLASIPSPQSTAESIVSLWSDFVQAVQEMLGLGDISGTILNDVIAVAPELFQGPDVQAQQRAKAKVLPKVSTNKKREAELDKTLNKTGVKKEDKKSEVEPEQERPVNFPMRVANAVFSFDAALNNAVKKAMKAANVDYETMAKVLTKISVSQALHADELSRMFAKYGNIQYNKETNKFEVIADPEAASYEKVIDQLKDIADREGLSLEKVKSYASQAFIARRIQSLKDEQQSLIAEAKALVLQGKEAAARKLLQKNLKIIHMTDAQMKEAMSFFKKIKGLNKVYDTWIEAKNTAIDVMVENEVLSIEEAEDFKQNVDYVPFYRDGMSGPKDFDKGLIDNSWHKFEGSYKPVADVFDNMDKWTRYSIRRSILNRAAINKIDATYKYMGPDQTDNPVAIREVPNSGGPNTVSINRIVNKETGRTAIVNYQFSDPTYAAAFGGLETILFPGISFASSVANLLRANIVLYPLFSLAQLPQDAVSAMFSSGVKRPLMIPLRVLKEFPLTLINMSKTHKDLRLKGAVGGFGSYLQGDTAADADLRKPGIYNKIRRGAKAVPGIKTAGTVLNRIAMASDNAIRQAVYEQTMSETGDAQLALERAFEVINFRRAGSSGFVTGLRQVVPFFGAALQALSVQGRVLQGKGIAPMEKAQAAKQFVSTLVQVQMLTLAYNALMAGDDEFEKLDPSIKDRRILFGNGYHLSLRPDLFTYLGKILPEHLIQYMYYESEDSVKMMAALQRGLLESFAVSVIPQAIRPFGEMYFNQNIRTGRPITPQRLDDKDVSMQATQSTSELAKLVGEASGVNPIKVDYFLRQYLGYTAGLGLMIVDELIDDADVFDYERATKSERDMLASIPGMSAFISREYGNRHTADFYELKKEVTAAVAKYKDLEQSGFSKERMDEVGKENRALIRANQLITNRTKLLTAVRKERKRILLAPRNIMSADDKKRRLDNANRREEQILSDMRELRKTIYDSGYLD